MKHGFSLVELSIVLVILGLLTGGILGGMSLMRAAEIRGFMADIDEQKVAISLFKSKYNGLPGDIPYATKFWPAEASCPNYSTDSTLTCDGNGDGLIDGTIHLWSEYSNVPIQLELAGLSRYQYVETSMPKPISSITIFDGWSFFGTNGRYHYLQKESHLGGLAMEFLLNNTHNGAWGRAVANPIEIWNIDQKFDDGKPLRGWIAGFNDGDPSTSLNCYDANKEYILSDETANGCTPTFWLE